MAIGEAFLSAFLQVLFDRLASSEFVGLLCGRKYDEVLDKLKITLLTVTTLLNDAEEKQFYNLAVKKWLHMTKDALYDAEDILDVLATEVLAREMAADQSPAAANKVWNWNRISSPLSPSNRGIESKLMKIIDRLELIAKYKNVLGLKDNVGGRLFGLRHRPPATSLVDESCVYGRNYDREGIIRVLLCDEQTSSKVGVVPIVGMSGIGKTTLTQMVFNDGRVEKHFDVRIWVFVSDHFDVVRVTKTILEAVNSKSVNLDDMNQIQVCLKEKLAGKRFLLVLDNVWDKKNDDWDLLCAPLKAGRSGSKIIVTTQNSDVASSMGTVPSYLLKGLPFEDCWLLFKSQAFENRTIDGNFEAIGKEIVKKCNGLPLAVKIYGNLLHFRMEEDDWKDILNRKIWDLPDDECSILQALRLSYHHLPAHLKLCFAYCSLFPVEYEFDKDSLVLLWMAEGFLEQSKGNKILEAVGGEYFQELVSRSFFQQTSHNRSRFIMHSLMKELAEFVSGEFCFRLEAKVRDSDQNKAYEKARHSSYIRCQREVTSRLESFTRLECLRTFLPLDPTDGTGISLLADKVPRHLIPKLRYLRVLSFNACRITELPETIGNLKHLRYLDLSRTAIKRLPDSMSMLYNLQTLLLIECHSLSKLPVEMGNLTSLRHIRISESRINEMPPQMCRLRNLQTLSTFIVGKDSGCGIRDLGGMVELKGSLLISGLQHVANFVDAMDADLKGKKGLDHLVFQWSDSSDGSLADTDEEEVPNMPQVHRDLKDLSIRSLEETMNAYDQEARESRLKQRNTMDDSRNERVEMVVLEMLQPHKNIKRVAIEGYGGTTFPSWIASPMLSNIIYLKLSDCRKCIQLPALGQLPSLKDLIIQGMEGIKNICAEFYGNCYSSVLPFPSLETLKFDCMINWEEWLSSGVGDREEFCSLQTIEISNCPKLKKFSQNFSALRKMRIKCCEELISLPTLSSSDDCLEQGKEFPSLLELSIRTCPNLKELPSLFPSLQTLEINGCQELKELPKLPSIRELEFSNEGVLVGLASLTYLHLHHISQLTCLREGFLQRLTTLKELHIAHLSEITTLSNEIGLQNLLNLQRLQISGCPFLMELPRCLYELSSLKEFRVWKCPSLLCFPDTGLPTNLRSLEIKGCDSLRLLPDWKMQNSNRLSFPLEYLVIEDCSSLRCFPRCELPSTLKLLEVQNCINLESLPKDMIHNNTSLEFLKITGCHSVTSFPKGTFGLSSLSGRVMNLKQLIIGNCANLQSLPEGQHNLMHLNHLEITQCPLLQFIGEFGLPNSMLKSIKISNCPSLKSLPTRLHSLTSLKELCIESCSSLVSLPEDGFPTNLLSLSIMDCEHLKPSFEWGLHRLTRLASLAFGGCQGLVSFPEDWLLPTSLSSLQLQRLPNLEALPERLDNLSLDNLEIEECQRLSDEHLQDFEILGYPLTSGLV